VCVCVCGQCSVEQDVKKKGKKEREEGQGSTLDDAIFPMSQHA
jgi:hypothetical protein